MGERHVCGEDTGSGWEDFGFLLETVLLPSRIAFQSVHSLVMESDDDGFGCEAIQGQNFRRFFGRE